MSGANPVRPKPYPSVGRGRQDSWTGVDGILEASAGEVLGNEVDVSEELVEGEDDERMCPPWAQGLEVRAGRHQVLRTGCRWPVDLEGVRRDAHEQFRVASLVGRHRQCP